jgi:hypothetical protein
VSAELAVAFLEVEEAEVAVVMSTSDTSESQSESESCKAAKAFDISQTVESMKK